MGEHLLLAEVLGGESTTRSKSAARICRSNWRLLQPSWTAMRK
jgi:hypothetical protein